MRRTQSSNERPNSQPAFNTSHCGTQWSISTLLPGHQHPFNCQWWHSGAVFMCSSLPLPNSAFTVCLINFRDAAIFLFKDHLLDCFFLLCKAVRPFLILNLGVTSLGSVLGGEGVTWCLAWNTNIKALTVVFLVIVCLSPKSCDLPTWKRRNWQLDQGASFLTRCVQTLFSSWEMSSHTRSLTGSPPCKQQPLRPCSEEFPHF